MIRAPLLMLIAVLVLPAQLFAQNGGWGSLAVRFVYHGEPPKAGKLNLPDIGGAIKDESLLVNPKNRGIVNVIVYLLPAPGAELRIHPSYDETEHAKIKLVTHRGRFEPHVLLLRTTQTLVQTNVDKIAHHARIGFLRQAPA